MNDRKFWLCDDCDCIVNDFHIMTTKAEKCYCHKCGSENWHCWTLNKKYNSTTTKR